VKMDPDNERWFTLGLSLMVFSILFVLVIFIVCIVLYETIVTPPRFLCDNQVLVFDDTASFVIQIVYRAIFSALQIIFGILLLISGWIFADIVEKVKGKKHHKRVLTIRLVALVGCLGLVMQGIYLLIIDATKTEQIPYLSLSILILEEIFPTYVFQQLMDLSSEDSISTSTGSKKQDDDEDYGNINFGAKPVS